MSERAKPAPKPPAPALSPRTWIEAESPRAAGARRAIGYGGLTLLLGLALVGLRPSDPNDALHIDVGMVLTLVSLVVIIGGIHVYGRLGPDEE
ncbi:hypothetical protein [Polyangium aurulentum]|uniref:hypothetical protein n=1 Tax=Polyangium aurulentum TaxID=2567896 RepID=UPI0010ADB5EE|nr:hypothetical protein [Polyangium aurulentum]UQA63445.1 hypothetical protein E8A73_024415 [Polyangium aurulentum]